MSTTIRPVLVLSFLMLSLSAEAEEMMDPFALIRQTLKYWLRVYKMYEEEVALGYCWAEYFLRLEENMKNASVSQPVPPESWSSEFNRDDLVAGGRKHALSRTNGSISMDSGRGRVRNRRSYGILDFAEASRTSSVVREKLEPIGRDIRVGYDRRSIDSRKQKGSSSSSRRDKQPDNRGTVLFPRKNKMILENDAPRNLRDEFKGNRTGGSTDQSRKFLSPEMGQGSSGSSPRFPVLLLERLKSFDASSPTVERVVDFDSRFDRLKVNRGEDDSPRGRKLGSSTLKLHGAEQRLSSFQENLRGKRETNDRIRGLVWPPSTIGEQEISMRGVESRSRNRIDTFGRKNRLFHGNVPRAAPTFGSGNTNVHSINARSNIRALPVIPEGIANVPEPFITINPRALPRNPSLDEEKKRGNNWGDENSSKQLPGTGDNRYRRNRHDFLVEMSDTGWNEAVRRPMGSPSLLRINYQGFMGGYGSWTRGTSRNSRSNRSSWAEDQGRRPLGYPVEPRGSASSFVSFFRVRDAFVGFLRTLGFFVQVGRELMDYVESNAALACTKDYLWGKAVQWIDS